MSFLSALGKIASIAGPIAAIPFTGGASAGLLGMSTGTTAALGAGLGAAGQVLGQGAASSKAGRQNDALLNAQMNNANNASNLNAAQFNMGTGQARMGQVARADALANAKDAPMTGDPRIDKFSGGGLRPSALGADTRTAANEQKRQALMALMSKSDQVTPAQSQIQNAGMLENLGGIAGLVGGLTQATMPPQRIATMGGEDINPYALDQIAQMRRNSPDMS